MLSERTDWKSLLKPCDGQISWESRDALERPYWQTDPERSLVSSIDVRPAGEISRLFITTVNRNGEFKTEGGDSWRVKINGTASLSPRIQDKGDGTYEVVFLCKYEGIYNVYIYLDYSLCNGLRDPPVDWFIRGNAQGKYQSIDVIGTPVDFLMVQLRNTPISINVPEKRANVPEKDKVPHCGGSCEFLWDGQGIWKGLQWMPYFKYGRSLRATESRNSTKKRGTLHVYGDSVSVFFAQSLKGRRTLIGEIFKTCSFSYNWVYHAKNVSLAKKQRDSLDFNISRVISELQETIQAQDISNSENVLILNFGLHFVESTNLSNYQMLISRMAEVLTRKGANGEPWFSGTVIWKTTTAINKERADFPQLHWRRFLTNYRIQLYNAYAVAVMCKHGIKIIDAYPISESYPFGTGTHAGRKAARNDVVHYNNEAFYPIELFLQDYFS